MNWPVNGKSEKEMNPTTNTFCLCFVNAAPSMIINKAPVYLIIFLKCRKTDGDKEVQSIKDAFLFSIRKKKLKVAFEQFAKACKFKKKLKEELTNFC